MLFSSLEFVGFVDLSGLFFGYICLCFPLDMTLFSFFSFACSSVFASAANCSVQS